MWLTAHSTMRGPAIVQCAAKRSVRKRQLMRKSNQVHSIGYVAQKGLRAMNLEAVVV